MIDYLIGALSWLKHRATILQQFLISKNKPSSIQSQIEVSIDDLDLTIDEITDLLNDASLKNPSYTGIYLLKLKLWVRLVDEIETIKLPLLERWEEEEERMQLLCMKICRESNLPNLVQPIIALYSPEYFFALGDVIYLPRLEGRFLLHLADLFHEISHILLELYESVLWEQYLDNVRNHFEQEHTKGILENKPLATQGIYRSLADSWQTNWSIEFTCDIVATYLCGPAYGWSHIHLCASKNTAENIYHPSVGEDETHPSDEARLKAVVYTLEDMGFIQEKGKIEKQWNLLVRSLGQSKPTNYHHAYPETLIRSLQQQIKTGLANLNIVTYSKSLSANDDSIAALLNRAWDAFWNDPLQYVDWETEVVSQIQLI